MKLAKAFFCAMATLVVFAAVAHAATVREEHVTNGVLDLVWAPGFGLSNTMAPLTLDPTDPAYNNPSGDHTVANAVSSVAPDSGGLILTCTDPAGYSDYTWEAWIFTGAGNTRRGLVVRASPGNAFQSCYQFVVQSGLFQLNFRKLDNQTPTTLGTWFANSLPAGSIATNTWYKMKVIAVGNSFRCFWDDYELTAAAIEDNSFASGWVGAYNFRFDLGRVAVYFDDLVLSTPEATPTGRGTWGRFKALYRR